MVEFKVDLKKIALINVDMQNCFVENSPISAKDGLVVLGRVNRLSDACRNASIPVIHTRFVLRADGSNMGILGKTAPPVKSGILNRGSESSAFHSGLVIDSKDIILDKPRFGAFHGTDLDMILKSRGIDTVIISGIATNVCCETTAREAMVRDFQVFFLSDCTAAADMGDASSEELQKASLATLGFLFAQVLTVDEMIKKIVDASQFRQTES